MQMWRRIWLRGRSRRTAPARGRDGMLISAVLGVGLALLSIYLFDGRVRPTVTELAKTRAANAVTRIINDAVTETLTAEAISYPDMVSLQTDSNGQITALTSNFVAMNRLRALILDQVVEQVDSLDTSELGIPLGNLVGLVTLSDKGPRLPVRILSVASAEGEFQNQFTAAGINQSYHRVMLDVRVTIRLLIPGGKVETAVDTRVNVAETVIVGKVPDAYLQFGLPSP